MTSGGLIVLTLRRGVCRSKCCLDRAKDRGVLDGCGEPLCGTGRDCAGGVGSDYFVDARFWFLCVTHTGNDVGAFRKWHTEYAWVMCASYSSDLRRGNRQAVNIRKFVAKAHTLDDLVTLGTLDQQAADFLGASVLAGLNIIVSGGTQAGKTTLLNCLAASIPGSQRLVSAEEVFELQCGHPDWVAMQTRQAGLEGTGGRSRPTRVGGMAGQGVVNRLRRVDLWVPPEMLRTANVAAVLVTAEVSP